MTGNKEKVSKIVKYSKLLKHKHIGVHGEYF